MAKRRDHRQTYEARNALARAQGYRNYAHKRAERSAGTPLPGDTNARPDLKQVTPVGTGKRALVKGRPAASSGRDRVMEGRLARASGQVKINVTTSDGVRHSILSKGGWSADLVRNRLADFGGDLVAFIADQLTGAYGGAAGEVVEVSDVAEYSVDLS